MEGPKIGKDAKAVFVICDRDEREDPDLAEANDIKPLDGGVLNPPTKSIVSSGSKSNIFKSFARILRNFKLIFGSDFTSQGADVIKALTFSIKAIPLGC